ncbi:MAG: YceI family protein [Aureibaculum sp.]|nr:YceI family protein [Aureibaculum sp.]
MKKLLFITLFTLSVFNLHAQHRSQNQTETKVGFKIKNFGVYVSGIFSEVDIVSYFDPSNIDDSYINAIIKVSSINTGNVKRDEHLFKEDFFDVDNFKYIKLESSKIEKISETSYILEGELTIKNTSKLISIPLELIENDDSLFIKSNFIIKRKDYSVGGNTWVLGNNVKIQVFFKAKK